MRVLFTPSARDELRLAMATIHKDAPMAARRLQGRIQLSLRRLVDFPMSGRIIPELPASAIREILSPPFRFFDRIEGDTVWIFGVWHTRQIPDLPGDE